jgi:transposase InsO family protein
MACRVAEVSRQAFYDWRVRVAAGPTPARQAEARLVGEMRKIHDELDGTYGSPRMTPELAARGFVVNHKRVERLMRLHGIVGVHKPAKVRTTIPAEENPPLPDLVGRRFSPGRPNVVWCGDITYVRTGEGWLYVASVIDLGSRRLLGYAMADHMRTSLVADALKMAAAARGGHTAGIVFHGDRGSQYMSGEYRDLIAELSMVQYVGRTGVCRDNAVAESFWSSLKRELVHRHRFVDRATARRAIFGWINAYNHRRLHSSLRYQTPVAWEQQYHPTQAARTDRAA